ncbi:MAG: MFS transporter [Betaproteobacteria bacterium]|nr:MFS transporter [Betaproteobacteria bacterium]
MHNKPARSLARSPIPSVIKRNTALFAVILAFTGVGMNFAFILGPLMVVSLMGDATLAGLAVGLIGLSRFLVGYPVGKITDTYGRKPGVHFGLALGLAGTVGVGLSMNFRSIALLAGAMLVFGMGMNAAQQLRVAATDMFPPRLRGQALGYLAMGSMLGVMVFPLLIKAAQSLAGGVGQDPLGLPWLLLPGLIVPGMFLVALVRPDPKEIGMHLERYFPDYTPEPQSASAQRSSIIAIRLLRHVPTLLAIVANTAAQGNMSIVMILTSLALDHHGHSLFAISVSMAFHASGMFAFSIPLGWAADRYGRAPVMFPGVAVTLVGAWMVAFTAPYWSITLGTFLVGVGWAAANIAATAAVADYTETIERGRAIGVIESFAGAMSVLMALVTGPLIEWRGLPAAGLTAIVVAAVPLLMLLATRASLRSARRAGPVPQSRSAR